MVPLKKNHLFNLSLPQSPMNKTRLFLIFTNHKILAISDLVTHNFALNQHLAALKSQNCCFSNSRALYSRISTQLQSISSKINFQYKKRCMCTYMFKLLKVVQLLLLCENMLLKHFSLY